MKKRPKKAAAKKKAPKRAAPKKASPKKAAPKRAAPKRASPKKAAPKRAAPKRRAPKGAAPRLAGKTPRNAVRSSPARGKSDWWELRLYVAGQTALGMEAFENLKRICEEHLQGRYRIEVVDLLINPTLARGDQILAVPTLVRQLPPPMKKIIGDFSNAERVLVGLNLRPLQR